MAENINVSDAMRILTLYMVLLREANVHHPLKRCKTLPETNLLSPPRTVCFSFWQIAFEFKSDVRLGYDVVVETKLYFNYLRADEAFYTMRSENPPLCHMGENCHRG